jgi:hypothetical protein
LSDRYLIAAFFAILKVVDRGSHYLYLHSYLHQEFNKLSISLTSSLAGFHVSGYSGMTGLRNASWHSVAHSFAHLFEPFDPFDLTSAIKLSWYPGMLFKTTDHVSRQQFKQSNHPFQDLPKQYNIKFPHPIPRFTVTFPSPKHAQAQRQTTPRTA